MHGFAFYRHMEKCAGLNPSQVRGNADQLRRDARVARILNRATNMLTIAERSRDNLLRDMAMRRREED
jgi:hypothetical protein